MEDKIDDNKDNQTDHPCICGHNLIQIQDGSSLYQGRGYYCDVCLGATMIAWHCDKDFHPEGFDICNNCIDVVDVNALIGRYCYCRNPLTRCQIDEDQKMLICRSCCREITANDGMTYDCNQQDCVYKTTSSLLYFVCPTCYHQSMDSTTNTNTNDNENAFIYRKFQSSINRIS